MITKAKISNKYKASALSYTLFVAVIASIILSSLILGVYYYKIEYLTYEVKIDNLANMSSATSLALAMNEVDYNQPYFDRLFSEGEDSVQIDFKPWGAWDVVKISTWRNQAIDTKYFSRAFTRSKEGESALYLVDENRPVSVAGKTKITGDAFLPKAGLRSAYINRIGYLNKQLIYGNRLVSKDKMPKTESRRIKILEQFLSGKPADIYSEELIIRDVEELKYMPFSTDTLIFNSYNVKNITDSLTGRIWINASERIIIDSTAYLKNVILTAPIIEIKTGFVGDLQAIATDSIIIRKNVKLNYPTFIAVLNEDQPAGISIENNSKVTGTVFLEGSAKEYNKRILKISESTEIEGMIYCHGLLETSGRILGHVTTRKFLINTFSGVYENYIFNTELDGEAINPEFLGTDIWFNSEQKKVLQWLY